MAHSSPPSPSTPLPPEEGPPEPDFDQIGDSDMTSLLAAVTQIEDPKSTPVESRYEGITAAPKDPKLLKDAPASGRSFSNLAPYFGFESGSLLQSLLTSNASFQHAYRHFNNARLKHVKLNSSAKGGRGIEFSSIVSAIEEDARAGTYRYHSGPADWIEDRYTSEEDVYAAAYSYLMRELFVVPSAPFKNCGIQDDKLLNRVHCLIMARDHVAGGFNKMVRHSQGEDRVIEAKQQFVTKRNPLPMFPVQQLKLQSDRAARVERAVTEGKKKKSSDIPELESIAIPNAVSPPDIPDDEKPVEDDEEEQDPDMDANAVTHELDDEDRELGLEIANDSHSGALGMDTSTPGTKKSINPSYPNPTHTPNPANPRARWFRDNYVIGYPRNVIEALQQFTETDWICPEDIDDPAPPHVSFNMGAAQILPVEQGPSDLFVKPPAAEADDIPMDGTSTGQDTTATTDAKMGGTSVGQDGADPAEVDDARPSPPQPTCQQPLDAHTRDFRLARFHSLRILAANFKINSTEDEIPVDDFTRDILMEAAFAGAAEVSPEGDKSEALNVASREREETDGVDQNDQDYRDSELDHKSLMDSSAYQPTDYRASLNALKIFMRTVPMLPGQSSSPNLWWQTNGAAELLERHYQAMDDTDACLQRAREEAAATEAEPTTIPPDDASTSPDRAMTTSTTGLDSVKRATAAAAPTVVDNYAATAGLAPASSGATAQNVPATTPTNAPASIATLTNAPASTPTNAPAPIVAGARDVLTGRITAPIATPPSEDNESTGYTSCRAARRRTKRDEKNPRLKGAALCDQVGIGKTITCLAKRLALNNNRKLDLQNAYDAGDARALAEYAAPRPMLWLTQPYLVNQTAIAAANYSSTFHVYVYGGNVKERMSTISKVTRIKEALTRDHALFNQDNELNSQVIIVSSYSLWHTRHGPNATKRWLMQNFQLTKDKAKARQYESWSHLGKRAPHDLADLFEEGVLDEAQATKGLRSQTSFAIRSLNLPFTTLVTATPIPYKETDFGGLLAFIQDPDDNNTVRSRLLTGREDDPDTPILEDPYALNEDETALLHTTDTRLAYTNCAFEHFVVHNDAIDAFEVGRRLSMIWRACMIRRDYAARCVVDHKGTEHIIGSSMPPHHQRKIKIEMTPYQRWLHDKLTSEFTNTLFGADEATEPFINSKNARVLNFASISPWLALANHIHDVKVDDRSKPRDSRGKYPKRENPHYTEYIKLFTQGQAGGSAGHAADVRFMRKLLKEIQRNARREGIASVLPDAIDLDKDDPIALATRFLGSSPKAQALFASLANQVDVRSEKAIIFCQGPFEQMLLGVLLRLVHIQADAYLSGMNPAAKQALIDRFNLPLRRKSFPGFAGVHAQDLEVLILSYYMNAGLNLQGECHNVHGFSPALSHPVWVQACGRVIRFGQGCTCMVYSYFVPDTFNHRQVANYTRNALPSIAALLCGRDKGEDKIRLPYEDFDHIYKYKDKLLDSRGKDFPHHLVESGEVVKLDRMEALLTIFNLEEGKTVALGDKTKGGSLFKQIAPLFSRASDLATPHRSTPSAKSKTVASSSKPMRKMPPLNRSDMEALMATPDLAVDDMTRDSLDADVDGDYMDIDDEEEEYESEPPSPIPTPRATAPRNRKRTLPLSPSLSGVDRDASDSTATIASNKRRKRTPTAAPATTGNSRPAPTSTQVARQSHNDVSRPQPGAIKQKVVVLPLKTPVPLPGSGKSRTAGGKKKTSKPPPPPKRPNTRASRSNPRGADDTTSG